MSRRRYRWPTEGGRVPDVALDAPLELQPLPEDRLDALAALLLEAFRGGPDDDGDTLESARVELQQALSGRRGRLREDLSGVVVDGRDLVGLCVVLDGEHGPHVAYIGTHPRHRRRRVAAALLARAQRGALASGARGVCLWVRPENLAAVALYEVHGFVGGD